MTINIFKQDSHRIILVEITIEFFPYLYNKFILDIYFDIWEV